MRVQSLLTMFAVKHIDLWVLDIEGGELEAVRSVDWSIVTIDVICVEVGFEGEKLKDDGVRDVLTAAGFTLHTEIMRPGGKTGGNWWFVHKSFTPMKE